MYKIVKGGVTVAMTEAPTYIKRAENGCFVLCTEEEAQGIAYCGTPYHLLGRAEMEGVESIILEKTDAGEEIQAAKQQAADADGMLVDQEYRLTMLELGLEDI